MFHTYPKLMHMHMIQMYILVYCVAYIVHTCVLSYMRPLNRAGGGDGILVYCVA